MEQRLSPGDGLRLLAAKTGRRVAAGDRYGWVAPIYELMESVWSLGAIQASRTSQTNDMNPDDAVLYVGAGCGRDAFQAAGTGAKVTLLDTSPGMLNHARRRFQTGQRTAVFHQGALAHYQPPHPFDVVVANYFLNIFPIGDIQAVMAQLVQLLKPGGRLMIADFAPAPRGLSGLPAKLNWYVPLIAANRITGEAVHALPDYVPLLQAAGLTVTRVHHYRPLRVGPAWYRSLIATKSTT